MGVHDERIRYPHYGRRGGSHREGGRGMPATDNSTPAKPYVYQVVEDDWNWAYKLTAIKDLNGDSIGNLSTRSATTDDLETNPFIFVNTKKTDIDGRIKNAESKTMNVFLPGRTEGEYIDSKQR